MYIKNLSKENGLRKKKQKFPSWMVTFTDLSLLMLTFFILLLTFANVNLQKFKLLIGSFQTSFGESNSSEEKSYIDRQLSKVRKYKKKTVFDRLIFDNEADYTIDKMRLNIMQFVNDNNLSNEVFITRGKRGIRMRIPGSLLFETGKVELKKAIVPLFHMLTSIVKENEYYLIIEGHTDKAPIKSKKFPSNWELSSARASSVVRRLTSMGVDEMKLAVVGYSSNYPFYIDDSAETQMENRRVEIVITNVPPRYMID